MVYIHTLFFICPSVSAKKLPRLPLSETGAVHYALFVLPQALTPLLAGVLDRSLSGCQNYRAFGNHSSPSGYCSTLPFELSSFGL